MGKKSRRTGKSEAPQQREEAAHAAPLLKDLQSPGCSILPLLRLQWTMAGKEEWWWIMDDSMAEIARQLQTRNYCVFDGFLGAERSALLEQDVKQAHHEGRLSERGHLAGGRTGQNLTYAKEGVRDDWLGWFDGTEEEGFKHMPGYMLKVQTLVSEIKDHIPELKNTNSRSRAMCTCYPGEGARYIRHVDNGNQNGRKLTAIMYLNPEWEAGDGGELRIFKENSDEVVEDVAPLRDRLLLFWSDARCPHEVMPSRVLRYAVTLWFYDSVEKREAEASEHDASVVQKEAERIHQEMAKFKVDTAAALNVETTPQPGGLDQQLKAPCETLPTAFEPSSTPPSARPMQESDHAPAEESPPSRESGSSASSEPPSPPVDAHCQEHEKKATQQEESMEGGEPGDHCCSYSLEVRLPNSTSTVPYDSAESIESCTELVICIRTPSHLTSLGQAELDVESTCLLFKPIPPRGSDFDHNPPSINSELIVRFPFPVLAEAAKARFSRKKGLLRITVPRLT